MTFKEKYQSTKVWYERVTIVELCHLTGIAQRGNDWLVANTALTLGISKASCSESLNLAKHPDLFQLPSRIAALKSLKGKSYFTSHSKDYQYDRYHRKDSKKE
jgi:hypothetical protein